MKKFFLSLAVFVMALCANAQTNQYFWYNGNLMMGNPIAQIDSVTFGDGESVDTLHILLPRTIIKTVRDTIYVTIHDTVCPDNIPEGALAGEFSVSSTKKVRFSKGNLQYRASTNTWRFAEHQTDTMGSKNSNISDTYDGWIDFFGWGTGNNPTTPSLDAATYSTFYDWGNNKISNGGNTENQWRTLTKDEWTYLLQTRNNATNLRSQATVNGIRGYVFLPDGWEIPTGINWQANANNWTSNQYSSLEWALMESVGAVFLPAAGGRHGVDVGAGGNDAVSFYWSSTPSSSSLTAWGFIGRSYEATMYSDFRGHGRSVRLVQDVE